VAGEGTARAESIEALAMHAFVTGAAPQARAALGISAARLGGGVVLAMAHDPTDYWSKALGFGVTEPVTRELLDEVCGFYRHSGVERAMIQIAPEVLPPDWPAIVADLGLERTSSWVKLQRHVTDPVTLPTADTSLRIGPVPEDRFAQWARVLFAGFGMPPELDSMGVGADPELCHRFAAFDDGGDIVAAASVMIDGDTAGLFGAGTLPGHRRRGAQSGLIAARVRAAVEAGARWISAETGVETPEEPNSSLHNLRRAGLLDRYERPNWVWRAA
jgi:hypothetical protein